MAIKIQEIAVNVVDAAKQRIKNIFSNKENVYLSFSSGKDSLCLASLTYDLILAGEIDRNLLTVIFIDEEGLYPSMVENTMRWHDKFEKIGVPFLWFCLPFKQVCVIDSLSAAESWITWEPGKEDLWMREPPPFAIMKSPFLRYPGEMNYQTFCKRVFSDGIQMIGIRVTESFTRIKAVSEQKSQKTMYPIYDWRDQDVWRYIRDHNLEFPEVYMHLYEAGQSRRQLRLCAFFGEGGTQGLHKICETDQELWEKICKREPNAYLALLYWDSEMFNRSTARRKELEKDQEEKDYQKLLEDLLFFNTDKYRINEDTMKTIPQWRKLYVKGYHALNQKHCKRIYEALIFGDPKRRAYRIMVINIFGQYNDVSKAEDGK